MSKIESAVQWMEKTAKDPKHGYDQKYRWGEKGDYDCSAAVITAWGHAGVDLKKAGATYTGNIKSAAIRCGFTDVTSKIDFKTGKGLKRGDILLKEGHHVAMYCGDGLEVEASINEKGTATGGKPGDQTGREFLIRSYRNYPWNCVLRYNADVTQHNLYYGHYVTTALFLNIRSDAGKNHKSIKVVKKGTKLSSDGTIKRVGNTVWVKVFLSSGVSGFVSSKYLKHI